jgi:hypothetical protein
MLPLKELQLSTTELGSRLSRHLFLVESYHSPCPKTSESGRMSHMPSKSTPVPNHSKHIEDESPAKKLRQERATLGSRQGDPDSPTSGTMYARRKRLAAELEQLQNRHKSLDVGSSLSRQMTAYVSRPMELVERDLRMVDEEISATQQRIDEIDQLLTTVEKKSKH